MSQYRTGFANVSYGTTTVVGSNTEWNANVTSGDTFKVEGIEAIYDISGVFSDTCLMLTLPYADSSQDGVKYQIHRDFTSNNRIPEIHEGDRDWPFYLTKSLRIIDSINFVSTVTAHLNLLQTSLATYPDGYYSGITGYVTSNGATSAGSVTMLSGTLASNITTTTLPAVRMALAAETSAVASLSLHQGVFKKANTFNFATTKIGYPVYVGTSGTITTTALAAGLYQQIAGIVLATNTVYFNPSFVVLRT